MSRYEQAREMFAKAGVDTEAALQKLAGIPISVHCWQGDDVVGFDGAGAAGDGIQTTGNYPGRARTPEELMADIRLAFSLMAGQSGSTCTPATPCWATSWARWTATPTAPSTSPPG